MSELLMKKRGCEDGCLAKGELKPIKIDVIHSGLFSLDAVLDRNKKGVV